MTTAYRLVEPRVVYPTVVHWPLTTRCSCSVAPGRPGNTAPDSVVLWVGSRLVLPAATLTNGRTPTGSTGPLSDRYVLSPANRTWYSELTCGLGRNVTVPLRLVVF